MGNEVKYKRIDLILGLCKENYKTCKAMIDYLSNCSVEVDRNFKRMEKQFDELKEEIHKFDRLKVTERHVYTDDELVKLKTTMSWNELHAKTKIPVSTLQYRCRRYRNETGTQV
jgi:predicted translin family RNA/ssDNA-binding protein